MAQKVPCGKFTELGVDKDDVICNVVLNTTQGQTRCVEDAMKAIRDNEQYHNESDGDSEDES